MTLVVTFRHDHINYELLTPCKPRPLREGCVIEVGTESCPLTISASRGRVASGTMDDHYSDSGVHDPETSATGNRNAASRCPQTALAMSLHRVYNQKLDLERGKLKQAQKEVCLLIYCLQ